MLCGSRAWIEAIARRKLHSAPIWTYRKSDQLWSVGLLHKNITLQWHWCGGYFSLGVYFLISFFFFFFPTKAKVSVGIILVCVSEYPFSVPS